MLYDLADWILVPARTALEAVVQWLSGVALVAAHGIEPARYLGAYAWLPSAWLALVKTTILCASLYAVLAGAKSVYSLYLAIKEGVKWW